MWVVSRRICLDCSECPETGRACPVSGMAVRPRLSGGTENASRNDDPLRTHAATAATAGAILGGWTARRVTLIFSTTAMPPFTTEQKR